MEMHHQQRATEVSPYAQATALASLMDYYEKQVSAFCGVETSHCFLCLSATSSTLVR